MAIQYVGSAVDLLQAVHVPSIQTLGGRLVFLWRRRTTMTLFDLTMIKTKFLVKSQLIIVLGNLSWLEKTSNLGSTLSLGGLCCFKLCCFIIGVQVGIVP